MANDDFAEDDDSDALERCSRRVNYIFDWQPYDTHTFNEFKHERDEVLSKSGNIIRNCSFGLTEPSLQLGEVTRRT